LVSLSGPNFTASFTYDALDRRTSKTVNRQTKAYHYAGSDLISETGAEYTFGPGIDEPLKRKSGQNEYYLSDALGSVIGLADGTGAIKTRYNYSPFGKKQTTGIASSNPFAFTSREDDETGYYYYRARYYNPDQKRFISDDSLGFGGGDTNLQGYVGNNPIHATDPSGEQGLLEIPRIVPRAIPTPRIGPNPSPSPSPQGITIPASPSIKNDDSGSGFLYRGMKSDGKGVPELGASKRTLGAMPDVDIPVVSGYVSPGTGGLSVSPGSPYNLPSHRRPPEFGGTGKDPVWGIRPCDLGLDLSYRPDPFNPSKHGFIEPSRPMKFNEYQDALGATRWLWGRML
jgi:RHS repeat-associated protein